MKWNIQFITDEAEDLYFSEINLLSVYFSAAIYRTLERFELGILPPKYIKALRNGIYELKTSSSEGEFRTLFFYQAQFTIVITHGFIKKTQKIPDIHVKKALRLRDTFFRINPRRAQDENKH